MAARLYTLQQLRGVLMLCDTSCMLAPMPLSGCQWITGLAVTGAGALTYGRSAKVLHAADIAQSNRGRQCTAAKKLNRAAATPRVCQALVCGVAQVAAQVSKHQQYSPCTWSYSP